MSKDEQKIYKVETYASSQIIFNEGDPSEHAYLVKSGSIEIFRIENNNHVIVNKIKQGEIFGEMGIISSAPRVASARAAETTRLIKFNKDDVLKSLKDSPPIVDNLIHLLIRRFEVLDNELRQLHTSEIFIKISNLIEVISKLKKGTNIIDYTDLLNSAKKILNVSRLEVDNALDHLLKNKLINIKKLGHENHLLEVLKPNDFLSIAQSYYETLTKNKNDLEIGQLAFIDIQDLSSRINISSEKLISIIQSGKIPWNLFHFHKDTVEEWITKNSKLILE